MPEHRIGSREEWQAAREELARLEAEQARRDEEITTKRRDLPWVPVGKEYRLDTADGKKTLAELFDGRSQLLAYNIMFGPDYTLGACPGCTGLADGLDGTLVHLNHRDVTLICLSRAPIERLTAYKQRMGWQFPYVSTYGTDFAADFGLAMTEEQAQQIPELQEMIDNPPGWLQEWSHQIGAELKDGLRENPAGSPSRWRAEPSTTPTRWRPPTRSSHPTSAPCSTGRPKPSPQSLAPDARTSTRTECPGDAILGGEPAMSLTRRLAVPGTGTAIAGMLSGRMPGGCGEVQQQGASCLRVFLHRGVSHAGQQLDAGAGHSAVGGGRRGAAAVVVGAER